MRFSCVALALVVGSSAVESNAVAQTPEIQDKIDKALSGKRKELDELLQQALKLNPDIRLAEAKLREAEAQFNKTRLEVLQKVVTAQQQIRIAEAALQEATRRLDRVRALHTSKAVSAEEVDTALAVVQRYKAELDLAKAALPALIGEQPAELRGKDSPEMIRRLYLDLLGRAPTPEEIKAGSGDLTAAFNRILDGRGREWKVLHEAVRGVKEVIDAEQAEKVRKFLATPFAGDYREIAPKAILDLIAEKTKGVNIDVRYPFADDVGSRLFLKEAAPMGAVLQWFEDNYPVRFVLREYGIVVSERGAVPPGALPVLDFWKRAEKDTKASPK
ncbi:MAG: hypothetical protein U0793_09705 [Gemmataceae bacterium]